MDLSNHRSLRHGIVPQPPPLPSPPPAAFPHGLPVGPRQIQPVGGHGRGRGGARLLLLRVLASLLLGRDARRLPQPFSAVCAGFGSPHPALRWFRAGVPATCSTPSLRGVADR